ncbi:hypothetical protein DPMN_035186 [Dreissena polymorpha]|uniref:Uncharacterized protein n=1 Tax=Dreissena polymorpha TaxID=45954 RepID=A0A9D4M973_DREPO|nr:hypothetical protein DPMN_035186 [Dreissena polymorpha]
MITSAEFNFDNITQEYLKSESSVELELSNLQERAHQLRAKTKKDRVLREDVDRVDLRELQSSVVLCTGLIIVMVVFFLWILRTQQSLVSRKTNIVRTTTSQCVVRAKSENEYVHDLLLCLCDTDFNRKDLRHEIRRRVQIRQVCLPRQYQRGIRPCWHCDAHC